MDERRSKLAVFGGSMVSGFGVHERSFGSLIAGQLGLELEICAGFGATLKDAESTLDVADDCAVVIAMYGTGEAMVRPTDRSLRFVPPRWRRSGWMDPRAYFPTNWRRALPKRIESAIRWRVKVTLIRLSGGRVSMDLDEFSRQHQDFLRALKQREVPTIVLIGPYMVDEKFYPRTPARIVLYDEIVRQQAEEEGLIYVSAIDALRRWDDYFLDHLHASVSGHQALANAISAQLELAKAKPQAVPSEQPAESREPRLASATPQTNAAEPPTST